MTQQVCSALRVSHSLVEDDLVVRRGRRRDHAPSRVVELLNLLCDARPPHEPVLFWVLHSAPHHLRAPLRHLLRSVVNRRLAGIGRSL